MTQFNPASLPFSLAPITRRLRLCVYVYKSVSFAGLTNSITAQRSAGATPHCYNARDKRVSRAPGNYYQQQRETTCTH